MSIFNDNITSEISQIEKIRCWFRERIFEQFAEYNNIRQISPEFCVNSANDEYITSRIHRDLATMWVIQYKSELRKMGVYNTRTNVKKMIGVNKFRVIVQFTTNDREQSIMFSDKNYDEIEVRDLKF